MPTNIEDISKFVLIGREKLASVRAEIRAINKLQIAEEVRNQKKEEAQLLAEALLDAEVKLGELFQQIPKDKSFRGNQYKSASNTVVTSEINRKNCDEAIDTDVDSKEWQSNTDVTLANGNIKHSNNSVTMLKTKEKIANEMGFDKMSVSRFETLAKNKDLVEQVKQEARENDDIATRTQVLSLAKVRKQMQEHKEEQFKQFCKQSEKGKKLYSKLIDSLGVINRLNNEDIRNCMLNLDNNLANDILERLKVSKLQIALLEQEAKKYKGVKIWQED